MPRISKYQPIWDSLKEKKQCTIVAHPASHRTIIKMVKNKRDDDVSYRYLQLEKGIREEIKTVISGNTIHFTLITRQSIGEKL